MGGGKVHQDQVGIHANLQHTGFCRSALGSGTADRSHHENCGSGQLGGVSLRGALTVGSLAHYLEHIQITGLHGTVGAQRHIDARLDGGSNGCLLQAVFSIGAGGNDGGCLLFTHDGLVLVGEGSASGSADGNIEQPVAAKKLRRGKTGPVQAVLCFRFCTAQVQLYA